MKHVVVGVISRNTDSGKEYLLMSSKKDFGEFTGFYYPPGGHLEEGEDEPKALKRELFEELQVEAIPIKEIAQSPGDVRDQTTHWWKCDVPDLNGMRVRDEGPNQGIQDVKWFSEKEIKSGEKIWPSTHKFFNQFILNGKQ